MFQLTLGQQKNDSLKLKIPGWVYIQTAFYFCLGFSGSFCDVFISYFVKIELQKKNLNYISPRLFIFIYTVYNTKSTTLNKFHYNILKASFCNTEIKLYSLKQFYHKENYFEMQLPPPPNVTYQLISLGLSRTYFSVIFNPPKYSLITSFASLKQYLIYCNSHDW